MVISLIFKKEKVGAYNLSYPCTTVSCASLNLWLYINDVCTRYKIAVFRIRQALSGIDIEFLYRISCATNFITAKSCQREFSTPQNTELCKNGLGSRIICIIFPAKIRKKWRLVSDRSWRREMLNYDDFHYHSEGIPLLRHRHWLTLLSAGLHGEKNEKEKPIGIGIRNSACKKWVTNIVVQSKDRMDLNWRCMYIWTE
jgi:hypothetical protein